MSKKIFRSIMAVAMIVLLSSLVITNSFLYDYFNKTQVERLKQELSLASAGVERAGENYFENFNSSMFRFTLISPSGEVIYDSQVQSDEMENHLDRAEIKQALSHGNGSSARYSSTLTERTFYEAVRLDNGNILRISATQVTVGALVLGMLPAICAIAIFSFIIALVLSQKMAKSIVRPLDELDLENPSANDTYEELTPVLTKINKQHKQIKRQMQQLKRKTDEFEQITDSMSEGLALLDKNGTVLSLNRSAELLFSTDGAAVGRDFLSIDRSVAMTSAVKKALDGIQSEFRDERNGAEYRFTVTPSVSDGKILGVVILCIDITEAAFAERNRAEFTANVSHELKTPLQSILGSADLLSSGLVKPEDTARFTGNIKSEAERLVALIDDIIRLSQLDEGKQMPREEINIYDIALEAVNALSYEAESCGVKLSLSGTDCFINGIKRYIYEIIYNLCDNAIRYNKRDGSVTVSVFSEGEKAVIKVSDTGIGIPPEHQSRIFERFYHVDKSHSRQTGGTGLGLSIVKHAVLQHNGKISLESRVGEGTVITVEL